jgi:hypothetical protein
MPDQPGTGEPTVHDDVAYEGTDAQLRPLLICGIGVVLLGVLANVLCLWVFDVLKAKTARENPGLPALAAKERPQLPQNLNTIPEPRLQVGEARDMERFRQAEEAHMKSYGWVDAKSGTVRIPIDEAMHLLTNLDYAKARGIRIEPAKDKGGGP